jgi:hypothetical protein
VRRSPEELVDELEKATSRYDYWLGEAYQRARQDGKKVLTEEEVRLTARNSLRAEKYRDPEVIRWDLRAVLSHIFEE